MPKPRFLPFIQVLNIPTATYAPNVPSPPLLPPCEDLIPEDCVVLEYKSELVNLVSIELRIICQFHQNDEQKHPCTLVDVPSEQHWPEH